MPEQIEAITGRRLRTPYRSMITAQAAHLPEVYRAKEAREYQREATGLRARELSLAEESQEVQQEQARRATLLQAVGTGALVGAQTGTWQGAAIGGAIGAVGWGISEMYSKNR